MVELLAASALLTLFMVVALGALVGAIPFGPLRFGAAGALFVGLAVGFLVPEMGKEMVLVQNVGLALFVYAVGLSAGHTFFVQLRRQYKLMLGAVFALILSIGLTALGAFALDLPIDLGVGIFAGATTTTPALAAASQITGSATPAVGYSLAYPVGVVTGIVAVALIVARKWPGKHDTASLAGQALVAVTAVAEQEIALREVPGWIEQQVKMSYLRSQYTVENADGGQSTRSVTRVISPGEILHPGDLVVVVGLPDAVATAVSAIGHQLPRNLSDDRSTVEFRSFIVSRPSLAGQSIAELNLPSRFGGIVTRIQRGDLELLAADDARIELGDRLAVAFPRPEAQGLAAFFGNSQGRAAEVDALTLGLGIVLGILVGMATITLPGGAAFSLGSAAGPLVVGMILGYLQRTGPLVWQLPYGANITVRQIGLLLFLAAVGISSGPAFAATAFSATGVKAGILGAGAAGVALLIVAIIGRLLGLSAARTVGAMAGVLGQPALLAFAQSKNTDERIESGYAAIFALGIVVKILLVSILLAF